MFKRADWVAIAKDRTTIVLMMGVIFEVIAIIVTTVLRLHASDVQVPARYTGYGTATIYRDQWYSLWLFSIFAVLITALNGLLALKTYPLHPMISRGLLGFTIFILFTELFVINAIFNLAPSI